MRSIPATSSPEGSTCHAASIVRPVSLGDERYDLRGSEVRTLATVGAFRVVPIDDLRGHGERAADLWHGDLEHLRSEGLLRHVASVDRESGTDLVTLTDRGASCSNRIALRPRSTSDVP